MTKKIKFLIRIMESFILNNKKENKSSEEKENLNEDEDSVILEKYKKVDKNISLFILSNKNIQVNLKDKTKIIFVCCEPKEIVYIDNKDEKFFYQIKNNNFNNFKCDEPEISKKINFAIKQIIK